MMSFIAGWSTYEQYFAKIGRIFRKFALWSYWRSFAGTVIVIPSEYVVIN